MSIKRTQHWTDEASGKRRVRTISNWSNYQDRAGTWAETKQRVRSGVGETFLGRDLDWVIDQQPLEFFVGNSSQAGGRPWWGIRKSNDLDTGIVAFMLYGDASAGYSVSGATKSITWADVLPGADLTLQMHRHRLRKIVRLADETAGEGGTGDRFTLGYVLPAGWTLTVAGAGSPGSVLEFRRPNGKVVYTSKPAYAIDSVGEYAPCAFIDQGTSTLGSETYHKIRVRIDRTGVTGWVDVDPDIVVTITADIEDATLHEYYPTRNYGGTPEMFVGARAGLGDTRGVVRIADSALPMGIVSACDFTCYPNVNMTLTGNAITTANTWTVGTGLAVAQTGSVCWDNPKYATQAWAGSAGCSTSGTDYVAADESVKAVTGGTVNTWSIPITWFDTWYSTNNGFLIRSDATWWRTLASSEAAGNQPSFTVTYEPAATGSSKTVKVATIPTVRKTVRDAIIPGSTS